MKLIVSVRAVWEKQTLRVSDMLSAYLKITYTQAHKKRNQMSDRFRLVFEIS